MPATLRYRSDDPTTKDQRELAEAAENERRLRAEIYRLASDQYDGKHKHFLKKREGAVDPNVVINRDGEAIDSIISLALPSVPKIELNEAAETPEEAWLTEAWEHNGGVTLLQDFMLFGALTGQCFARVMEAGEDDEYPQVIALHPTSVLPYWRADDMRRIMWYELQWTAGRKYRQDFINLKEFSGEGWQIRTYVMEGNRWILIATDDWAYTLSPILDWQHLRDPRRYYGKSHILESKINDRLNKIASDVNQIIRIHAAPRTIGKGLKAEDIQSTGIDAFFTIPAEADVEVLEMQSDLAASINFFHTLAEEHSAEMHVVRLKGGVDAYKGITNLGLKVAYMPMLAQNDKLHEAYARGIIGISRRLLELGKKTHKGKITLKWELPLPMSETEQVQTVKGKRDMGLLSKESASTELGLDYELEQERIKNEGGTPQEQVQRDAQNGNTNIGGNGNRNGNGAVITRKEMA